MQLPRKVISCIKEHKLQKQPAMAGVTQKWNSLWHFFFSSWGPYSKTTKNISSEAVQKVQRYLGNRGRGLQIQKKL